MLRDTLIVLRAALEMELRRFRARTVNLLRQFTYLNLTNIYDLMESLDMLYVEYLRLSSG